MLNYILSGIPNTVNMTYDGQLAAKITLMVVMVIAAIAMIVVVLMQQGTNENVGVITGATDSFYGKNKAQTKEGRLKKITFILFVLLMVTSIIYFIIQNVDLAVYA